MSNIKRALLSVSDKQGIEVLASVLADAGVEILSTGGTASLLRKSGIKVKDVSEHTGFPEIMDGRVKTLHPKIHGGILARRGQDEAVMAEQDITPIDLVVVNLYPFRQTVAKDDCSIEDAIENIDIGGPCMIRASAKNHRHVSVVVDPSDYSLLIEKMQSNSLDEGFRRMLAVKAFAHTASYDGAIANHFSSLESDGSKRSFPDILTTQYVRNLDLRYGENPHQDGVFYADLEDKGVSIADCEQLQGKTLSYNNIADMDAAYACVRDFETSAAVIVKHANPCGVAIGEVQSEAYEKARAADATSAFGGIASFNRCLDAKTAALIAETFMEVVIAPDYEAEALSLLATKKNLRVMRAPSAQAVSGGLEYKRVNGGLLVQQRDTHQLNLGDAKVVSRATLDGGQEADLMFAWTIAKHVKSNAIIFAKNGVTTGIGAGQMSRIDSTQIAVSKGGDKIKGSVVASDAFFPFRDGIDALSEAGATAVIQPGGSMRDEEVIKAADDAGIGMLFTGVRHFRH
ncbi:MAG: bifunctional phosphoribosylaminoimidazolecarboxamide formyltransferase/IMP cyclohydrolase [Mariprofundaceae bacterium]|nr:bifunctional phosphoribosylaminoimidazolecarboxamide formyltransferase/IMP cyclohydrolase [Mariprofundaceae bacterium]